MIRNISQCERNVRKNSYNAHYITGKEKSNNMENRIYVGMRLKKTDWLCWNMRKYHNYRVGINYFPYGTSVRNDSCPDIVGLFYVCKISVMFSWGPKRDVEKFESALGPKKKAKKTAPRVRICWVSACETTEFWSKNWKTKHIFHIIRQYKQNVENGVQQVKNRKP